MWTRWSVLVSSGLDLYTDISPEIRGGKKALASEVLSAVVSADPRVSCGQLVSATDLAAGCDRNPENPRDLTFILLILNLKPGDWTWEKGCDLLTSGRLSKTARKLSSSNHMSIAPTEMVKNDEKRGWNGGTGESTTTPTTTPSISNCIYLKKKICLS
jgi:hypothetical protein